MTVVYATRQDLDDFGNLPDGMLSNEGRLAHASATPANTIELEAHGFVTNALVQVRALEGGALPSPLVDTAVYFAIWQSDSLFKLAASASGAAIAFATAQEVVVIKALPVDRMLEAWSRWVEDHLPAHLVPLEREEPNGPYPIQIVKMVAQLTAAELLGKTGKDSELVTKARVFALEDIKAWVAGRPLRDPNITGSANLAVTAGGPVADPPPWGPSAWSPGCCQPGGYGQGRIP